MILSALITYGVISGEARVIVLYVIAGGFGLSEIFGMGLVSHFGNTMFPQDLGGFFGICRSFEGFSVGIIVVLSTYTPPIVVISIICAFAIASVLCNMVLIVVLRRQKAAAEKTQNPIETLDMPVVVNPSKQPAQLGVRQLTMFKKH